MNNKKYFGNEIEYVKEVLDSGKWASTGGSFTTRLEKLFCKRMGSKYAVAMNSGTSTLHSALIACGVKPGDEVITSALTVFMDTTCILMANAIPVYADVDRNTFNINPNDVESKITEKTKAIIGVSLYGMPCDTHRLKEIAEQYGLCFILDNAQHMGKHEGHITSYSFENSKHISCGEGGLICTNNEEYARKIRMFGNHGFKNSNAEEGRTKLNLDVFQNPNYKRHTGFGYNYRLSEICSAVAFAQFENVDEIINRRRMNAEAFLKEVEEIESRYKYLLEPQESSPKHTYWTLALKYEYNLNSWKKLRERYVKNGGDGFYGCWSIPYEEPFIKTKQFIKLNPQIYSSLAKDNKWPNRCEVAEAIQPRIMQLKTNYRNKEELKEKAKLFRETLEGKGV